MGLKGRLVGKRSHRTPGKPGGQLGGGSHRLESKLGFCSNSREKPWGFLKTPLLRFSRHK